MHELFFENDKLVAFSRWFLLKMIWLQSKPECTGLHNMCQKITVELLQAIKWRDLYCFSQLLTELIHTVTGVCTIPQTLSTIHIHVSSHLSVHPSQTWLLQYQDLFCKTPWLFFYIELVTCSFLEFWCKQ